MIWDERSVGGCNGSQRAFTLYLNSNMSNIAKPVMMHSPATMPYVLMAIRLIGSASRAPRCRHTGCGLVSAGLSASLSRSRLVGCWRADLERGRRHHIGTGRHQVCSRHNWAMSASSVLPGDVADGLLDLIAPYFAGWPVASWILTQFPQNPTRQFQQLYCMWLAVQLMLNLRAHVRFLAWFDASGLELARKRGLGAHPSKLYGLITPPRLSAEQLRLVGLALIGCLLAACAPVLPRVFLCLAYILSLCYFPQLYAEVSCSGHSTILIPSILFILSCSSSLDHQVSSARDAHA